MSDWLARLSKSYASSRPLHVRRPPPPSSQSDDNDDDVSPPSHEHRRTVRTRRKVKTKKKKKKKKKNEDDDDDTSINDALNRITTRIGRTTPSLRSQQQQQPPSTDTGSAPVTATATATARSYQERRAEQVRKTLGYDPIARDKGWRLTPLYRNGGDGDDDDDDNDDSRMKGKGVEGDEEDPMQSVYNTEDYCFLCAWYDAGEDAVEANEFTEMIAIWMQNVWSMNEETRAFAVSEFQRTRIYEPMRAKGMRIGRFTPEMALEHFTLHVHEPNTEQASILRDLKELRRTQMKCITKTNSATGEVAIDKDGIANMRTITQMIRDVSSWKPKNQPNYCPEFAITPEKMRSVFSLHRRFRFDPDTERKKKRLKQTRLHLR